MGMLDKIRTNICPDCTTDRIRRDMKFNQHCNGHWNETREFDCGHTLEYSPNVDVVKVTGACRRSKAYSKKRDARSNYLKTLMTVTIPGAPIDDDFKKTLLKALGYIQI